jgi:hypothetical protein
MLNRIKNLKAYGARAKGRSELLKHFEGKRLNSGEAILAKCYECLGYYADGKRRCTIPSCPLYPWMPYGNAKAD